MKSSSKRLSRARLMILSSMSVTFTCGKKRREEGRQNAWRTPPLNFYPQQTGALDDLVAKMSVGIDLLEEKQYNQQPMQTLPLQSARDRSDGSVHVLLHSTRCSFTLASLPLEVPMASSRG